MNSLIIRLFILINLVLLFTQCKKKEDTGLIASEQEYILGSYLDTIILNDPEEYNILDRSLFKKAYGYADSVLIKILKSGDIKRKSSIKYTLRIIDSDEINFFVFPGGYMYINTGFIKYLDNGAQFAGAMAHQVAHIDRRHLTGILENKLDIDVILGITIWGDSKYDLDHLVENIITGSEGFVYPENIEYEADEYAVKYTSATSYDPLGIAGFLSKADQSNQNGNKPGFLSAHPFSDLRVEKINQVWEEIESPEGGLFTNEYRNFVHNLP